jgi:predicted phage terminase large subunit-like protein
MRHRRFHIKATALTRLAEVRPEIQQRAFVDLNPVGKGHWTNRLFREGIDPVSRLPLAKASNYLCSQLNPKDNINNLSEEYIAYLDSLPEKQRKRFLEGEYVDEIENALWTYEMIDKCRVGDDALLPDMQRVVVGVDPSGAAGHEDERSDEIGIIAAGLGTDGRGYVLADYSGRFAPEAWAERVLFAWDKHKADLVVAEKNFGGAMVEAIIQSQANARGMLGVKIDLTVASRGKIVRAEPVSALYAADRVRHVGRFADLEEQMLCFSSAGYLGPRSPDRADAMVWALSSLLVEDQDFSGLWARFGAALN